MNSLLYSYRKLSDKQRMFAWMLVSIVFAALTLEANAINIATLIADPNNPLASALTTVNNLAPGVKALAVIVGFLVAVVAISLLKQFGAVVVYGGVAIFAAVGLPVALAIAGYAI
jgi:hypothetical protein